MMKTILACVIASTAALTFVGSAEAGCIKGAIVGGVVGHVAGGHGGVGAAAGCAISHHSDAKKKQAAAQGQQPH